MHAVIMGSGRIGARVAAALAEDRHEVVVIDRDRMQVMYLPQSLVDSGAISLVIGDGTSARTLQEAGIEDADVFLALTGSDTVNGLAAQKARVIFRVRRVICRVKDDGLRELYGSLGLTVTSPTALATDVILQSVPDGR